MSRKGFPVVLSAPSGAGKTTLAHLVVDAMANLVISTSYTTRECRGKERDGIDYHFVSNDKFEKIAGDNIFLEWAKVHGARYGSDGVWTKKMLDEGNDVIFDIDVQGGLQIKKKDPRAILIFILPPSIGELEDRLAKRGTDSKERIAKRIESAKEEITVGLKDYDYVINNEKLDRALFDLTAIIRTHRLMGINRNKIAKRFFC